MAVNPIVECFWMDFVTKYCEGLVSSAVYTAPPCFVESVHCGSNRSLPCLPLHMYGEDIIPTILTSNVYIGICLPKVLTLSRLRSYKMFEVLLIMRIIKRLGLRGILNFRLLRHPLLNRLARGIPLKEGVLYPLQSKVGTPPPYLR
jgi:hypothetical protein